MKGKPPFELRVLRARMIYSDGRHNAFPGFTRFGDRYFVAFRQGDTHMGGDPRVRIIASDDLEVWEPTIPQPELDMKKVPREDQWTAVYHSDAVEPHDKVRDPFLVNFKNRLFCFYSHAPHKKPRKTIALISSDGEDWGEPIICEGLAEDAFPFHAAAHDEALYLAAYAGATGSQPDLYRSADGLHWERIADVPVSRGNEVYLHFAPDGTLWALARRKGKSHQMEALRAGPPYTDFDSLRRLSMSFGGPMIKRLPTGCVIITRSWDADSERRSNLRTEIYWLPDGGELQSVTRLPSGGDTSYATWLDTEPDRALVAYYSSHRHNMDTPVGTERNAEHLTGADIFLAEISYQPAFGETEEADSEPEQ